MTNTRFGIWKKGFWSDAGEWQPSALMKICDTKAEAEEQLRFFETNKHYIEPY